MVYSGLSFLDIVSSGHRTPAACQSQMPPLLGHCCPRATAAPIKQTSASFHFCAYCLGLKVQASRARAHAPAFVSHSPSAWPCFWEEGSEFRDAWEGDKPQRQKSISWRNIRSNKRKRRKRQTKERDRKSENKEEKVWRKLRSTLSSWPDLASFRAVLLFQLLWCAFLNCALLYQVNDVDMDHGIKSSWS